MLNKKNLLPNLNKRLFIKAGLMLLIFIISFFIVRSVSARAPTICERRDGKIYITIYIAYWVNKPFYTDHSMSLPLPASINVSEAQVQSSYTTYDTWIESHYNNKKTSACEIPVVFDVIGKPVEGYTFSGDKAGPPKTTTDMALGYSTGPDSTVDDYDFMYDYIVNGNKCANDNPEYHCMKLANGHLDKITPGLAGNSQVPGGYFHYDNSNSSMWSVLNSDVVAHETGHSLTLSDEYNLANGESNANLMGIGSGVVQKQIDSIVYSVCQGANQIYYEGIMSFPGSGYSKCCAKDNHYGTNCLSAVNGQCVNNDVNACPPKKCTSGSWRPEDTSAQTDEECSCGEPLPPPIDTCAGTCEELECSALTPPQETGVGECKSDSLKKNCCQPLKDTCDGICRETACDANTPPLPVGTGECKTDSTKTFCCQSLDTCEGTCEDLACDTMAPPREAGTGDCVMDSSKTYCCKSLNTCTGTCEASQCSGLTPAQEGALGDCLDDLTRPYCCKPITTTPQPPEDEPYGFSIIGDIRCIKSGNCSACDLANVLFAIGIFVLEIIGAVTLFFIFLGGFFILTAAGESSKIEKGKRVIINSIIGLVLVFSAFLLVNLAVWTITGTASWWQPRLVCNPPGSFQRFTE